MLPVTWEEFARDAEVVATQLVPYASNFKTICGVPRGGLVLAVYLSHYFDKPLVRSQEIDETTLVVDDNVVTGDTLAPYWKLGCLTAALLVNPNAALIEHAQTVGFFYARTTPEWPVFPWEPR